MGGRALRIAEWASLFLVAGDSNRITSCHHLLHDCGGTGLRLDIKPPCSIQLPSHLRWALHLVVRADVGMSHRHILAMFWIKSHFNLRENWWSSEVSEVDIPTSENAEVLGLAPRSKSCNIAQLSLFCSTSKYEDFERQDIEPKRLFC